MHAGPLANNSMYFLNIRKTRICTDRILSKTTDKIKFEKTSTLLKFERG